MAAPEQRLYLISDIHTDFEENWAQLVRHNAKKRKAKEKKGKIMITEGKGDKGRIKRGRRRSATAQQSKQERKKERKMKKSDFFFVVVVVVVVVVVIYY